MKKRIIFCFLIVCVVSLFCQDNDTKDTIDNDSKSINLLSTQTNIKESYSSSQAVQKQASLSNKSTITRLSNQNLNTNYQMKYQSNMRNDVIHYKNKVYYIGYNELLYQMDLSGKNKKVFCDIPASFPHILYAFKNFVYFSVYENDDTVLYRINISNGVKTKLFNGDLLLIDTYTGKIYYEVSKYNKNKDMIQVFIMYCEIDGSRKKLLYQKPLGYGELIGVDLNQNYYILSTEDKVFFSYNKNKKTKKIVDIGSYRYIEYLTYYKDYLYFSCFVFSGNAHHLEAELFCVKQDGTNLCTKTMYDNTQFSLVKNQLFYCDGYADNQYFYKMDLDFTNETLLLKRISPGIYPSKANNWFYYVKNNNIYRYNVLTNAKQLILKRKDYFKSALTYKKNYKKIETKYKDIEAIETKYEDMEVIDNWLYFSFCIYGYKSGNGGKPICINKQYCRIQTNRLDFEKLDEITN